MASFFVVLKSDKHMQQPLKTTCGRKKACMHPSIKHVLAHVRKNRRHCAYERFLVTQHVFESVTLLAQHVLDSNTSLLI